MNCLTTDSPRPSCCLSGWTRSSAARPGAMRRALFDRWLGEIVSIELATVQVRGRSVEEVDARGCVEDDAQRAFHLAALGQVMRHTVNGRGGLPANWRALHHRPRGRSTSMIPCWAGVDVRMRPWGGEPAQRRMTATGRVIWPLLERMVVLMTRSYQANAAKCLVSGDSCCLVAPADRGQGARLVELAAGRCSAGTPLRPRMQGWCRRRSQPTSNVRRGARGCRPSATTPVERGAGERSPVKGRLRDDRHEDVAGHGRAGLPVAAFQGDRGGQRRPPGLAGRDRCPEQAMAAVAPDIGPVPSVALARRSCRRRCCW